MNLIKNDDFQEEPAMTAITPDDELDDLFSFDDDPDFLSACEQGHAELRRLVLDRLSAEHHNDRDEPRATTSAPNNDVAAKSVRSPSMHVAPSSLNRRPTFRWASSIVAAAAAASVIGLGLTSILAPVTTTETISASSVGLEPAEPLVIPEPITLPDESPGVHTAANSIETAPSGHAIDGNAEGLYGGARNVIAFAANSSVLSPDAETKIRNAATAIRMLNPDRIIVQGFAADPPESTPSGRARLAEARARAVAAALAASGVPPTRIVVAGSGSPDVSSVVDGVFNAELAAQMRRAEIGYR